MPASLRARTALGTLTGGPQPLPLVPRGQTEAKAVLVRSLRREVVPALPAELCLLLSLELFEPSRWCPIYANRDMKGQNWCQEAPGSPQLLSNRYQLPNLLMLQSTCSPIHTHTHTCLPLHKCEMRFAHGESQWDALGIDPGRNEELWLPGGRLHSAAFRCSLHPALSPSLRHNFLGN